MSEIAHANRHHFDGRAKDYDTKPWQKKLIAYVTGELVEHRDFFGLPTQAADQKPDFRLLDYACGPGTITRALLPYISHAQGVDISDAMVEEYNSRSTEAGTAATATAVQGNLLAEDEPPYVTETPSGAKISDLVSDPRFNGFDAALVGLGFHHFTDFSGSLAKLALRVRPGGVVGIIDLAPSQEHWHHIPDDMKKMMHKSGFTDEEMKGYMAEAGLVDFEMQWLPEDVTMIMKNDVEVRRRMFFARGRKP